MPATLGHLITTRSQLAEEVMRFLQLLAERLDGTPWVRQGGARLRASDIAVEPWVLTQRLPTSALDQAMDRASEEMARRSLMEEIEAGPYELPTRVEERAQLRWHQVLRRGRGRLGVRGAPGSGKTFITRHTMVTWARRAAEQVERYESTLESLAVPFWVTAQALAQAPAGELHDALLDALESSLQLPSQLLHASSNLRSWLHRAIDSARAFVVVDALDELLEGDRKVFQTRASQLDSLPGRVLVTCRTMQWDDRKTWLGWQNVTEVELVPLQRRQQHEFGRKFFAAQPALATRMARLLDVNVALRQACTTPLLLTFACLLHEEGKVNETMTHALLYAYMLRHMVHGEWREAKPTWVGDEDLEDDCLLLLEAIAWRLFARAPHRNRFTRDDWNRAAREAGEEYAEVPIGSTGLRRQLRRVGFIVPAGFDERGDRCWSFAHRTFLEFLAARALSRHTQDEWLGEARKHLWFAPEWLEVLTFLAGLVEDATPLVEAVEHEEDDLFGSMLYINTRLIGATPRVDDRVVQRICEQVSSYCQYRPYMQEVLVSSMFSRLSANTFARDITTDFMVEVLGHTDADDDVGMDTRRAAAVALGELGSAKAVEPLLALFTRKFMHWSAAEALGQLGSEKAVEPLFALLAHADDEKMHRAAAVALGELGSAKAVEPLLALLALAHPEWFQCKAAAVALWQIAWKNHIPIKAQRQQND